MVTWLPHGHTQGHNDDTPEKHTHTPTQTHTHTDTHTQTDTHTLTDSHTHSHPQTLTHSDKITKIHKFYTNSNRPLFILISVYLYLKTPK